MRRTWLVCEWKDDEDGDNLLDFSEGLLKAPTVVAEFIERSYAVEYVVHLNETGRQAFSMAPDHPLRKRITGVDYFFKNENE